MIAPERRQGFAQRLEARLVAPDVLQVFVGYLVVLGFVLLTRWPVGSSADAAVWYPLAQARALLGALLGLGYGSVQSARRGRPGRDRATTLAVLSIMPLLASPLDAAAHGASYPAVPFAWSLASGLATVAAFFALGLGLGWIARRLRLVALLPLLVPGVLALGVVADVRLGVNVFNPIAAATAVAPVHAALLLAGSAVAVGLAVRSERSVATSGVTP